MGKKIPAFWGILAAFLTDYGLLGGIFAFFDTSGMHYGYAPLTVHSYLWHIVLIFIGLTAACIFPSSSKWSCFLGSTALFLVCCLIALILDLTLDSYGTINMFYINPDYPMAQKYFLPLPRNWKYPGYFSLYWKYYLWRCLFHIIWRQAASRLIGRNHNFDNVGVTLASCKITDHIIGIPISADFQIFFFDKIYQAFQPLPKSGVISFMIDLA